MNRILSCLIQNSITMTFVIVFYIIATTFLIKNYVAKWRYYSWAIPVAALLIPIRIPIPVLLKSESMLGKLFCRTQKLPNGLPNANTVISGYPSGITMDQVLTAVWILGMICFFVYFICNHFRFFATVKRWGEEVTDQHILECYDKLAQKMAISNLPRLICCSCTETPMMLGFFRPILILPHLGYETEDLQFLLKHELVHYKRKDIWYKLIIFLASTIYWFHPAVYWMAREISEQCEISCDEEVLKNQGKSQRKQYGNLILSMIENQTKIKTVFTTNFQTHKSQVRKRILCIMNGKKKRKGVVLTCMMLMSVLATGITFQRIQPEVALKKTEPVKQLNQSKKSKNKDYQIIYASENSKGSIDYDVDHDFYMIKSTTENVTVTTADNEEKYQNGSALSEE